MTLGPVKGRIDSGMRPHAESGITITEVLVAVVIAFFLVYLALPRGGCAPVSGQKTQTLSNAKQLYLATQQMALDGEAEGKTNLGWPGDTGGTFSSWVHQLLAGPYLTTNDFRKLMSAPGMIPPAGEILTKEQCALLAYAVSSNSSPETVFLTTANFTNTPAGGLPPEKSAKPYGDKGFVIFRRGGDGAILQPRQAGQTNIIGGSAPLLR